MAAKTRSRNGALKGLRPPEGRKVACFTEDDTQKKKIRPILEQWGEVNYDGVMKEFFHTLPSRAVNTRLVRLREAKEWVAARTHYLAHTASWSGTRDRLGTRPTPRTLRWWSHPRYDP